ncbi:hypothetical protein ABZ234_31785 [Nocardiopsis sp. NPDC006198]|uniref:hypothetical protein n=1 Tax=Nocardiopsis sp. NPDC006198 TaxID=3154472 RepID=UPI0033A9C11A
MSITVRPTDSDDTHRILGSVPGWAHCGHWVDGGETLAEGEPITCPVCSAQAAREAAALIDEDLDACTCIEHCDQDDDPCSLSGGPHTHALDPDRPWATGACPVPSHQGRPGDH